MYVNLFPTKLGETLSKETCDVSIVTFPAYPTTSAEVKRSLEEAQEKADAPSAEASRVAAAASAQAEADTLNATPRICLD